MVYVINFDGHPLMPTERHRKVRKLLNNKQAKIVNRCPFTIQLLYEADDNVQDLTLGVDAGSKMIGVSVSSKDIEYYSSEIELRRDICDLLSSRRESRRTRRSRKLRYRIARFDNHNKEKGWIAPSIRQRIDSHLQVIENINKMLPIAKIIVEVASFDTQLLKAQLEGSDLPIGKDYQNGELFGWNLREYIFHRDNYTCQWCKGKSKDSILVTHHWNYWRGDHTNKPGSMITLCNTCNDSKNHKPEAKMLWGWEPRTTHNFKDASFMGVMRWAFYNELKNRYNNVSLTYGYITKNTRINAGLPKEHRIDALCIAKHPDAKLAGEWFYQKKIRCHNRQIHKLNPTKGGNRKLNQAPYLVNGYRLFDKVLCKGKTGFIFGRRLSGSFDIRTLDGVRLSAGITYKKLKLIEKRKYYITERIVAPLITKVMGLHD